MSWKHLGVLPDWLLIRWLRLPNRRLSGSIRWVTWTPGILRNSPMWSPPRPWMPATPIRTVSFAPSTRPDDFVPAITKLPATPAAAAWRRNVRREWRVMGILS